MRPWDTGGGQEETTFPKDTMLAPLNQGPRPCSLSFQSSQPGLESGLGTTEICHHGLHLLPMLLAECLHLHGSLGFLVLLQQPVMDGNTFRVTQLRSEDCVKFATFNTF